MVTLNFINQSNDENNSSIVIFQSTAGSGILAVPSPWTLHLNCPPGNEFSFTLPALDAALPYITVAIKNDTGLDETASQEFDLTGISNANIILSGGGEQAAEFTLEQH